MPKLTLNSKFEHKHLVAAIYTCILFLDRLNLTIVNITLPTIAQDFNLSITQTEWISNSFLIALAIVIPISGWLGDKFGVKKVFILATSIFGLGSFLCAFSPDLISMVIFRFLQGIGGGILIPVGMTMLYRLFEPSEYASITSFTFLPSLLAPAIAPFIGGMITSFFGWKWVFIFSFPFCFLAVLVSFYILKEQKNAQTPPLDWGGFVLVSLALVCTLQTVSMLGKHGFNILTSSALVITFLLIVAFFSYEEKISYPLIDLKFFKKKLFIQANILQFVFQICHFGSIFLIGIYLQIGVGMSAMISGLIMGMHAFGTMFTSRYSVKLFNKYGASIPIISGLVGIALFTSGILFIRTPSMVIFGAVIFFLRGVFSGFCGTPIQTLSIIDFDKSEVSHANAIFNVGRQISICFGVSLSSFLISFGFRINGITVNSPIDTIMSYEIFHYAFFTISFMALAGILCALRVDNLKVIMRASNEGQGESV